MTKGKYVLHITVIDPDSRLPVNIDVYKLETGAMVGVDSSFLSNTDEPVYSPYDVGDELKLD